MAKKKAKIRKVAAKSMNNFHRFTDTSKIPQNSKILWLEYYQKAFALFHKEYSNYPENHGPHPIRNRFWQFIQEGTYDLDKARAFLEKYLFVVEREMSEIIQKHSLAYWIHTSRRMFPGAIGEDKQPTTISLTRAVLDAAIQKYAKFDLCNGIAFSKDVSVEDIFRGLLMAPEFEMERELIKEAPNQLVLTNFSIIEFIEFYRVEKLCYEVWKATANLRSIAKGATFVIENSSFRFGDERTDELDFLLKFYDERSNDFSVTSIGTMFSEIKQLKDKKTLASFVPSLNAMAMNMDILSEWMRKVMGMKLEKGVEPNFIWFPINLKYFREAHLPLADAFREKYNVDFDAVLVVVAGICYHAWYRWIGTRGARLIHHWSRAYDGPEKRDIIIQVIRSHIPVLALMLDISSKDLQNLDLDAALNFWTLDAVDRNRIDLSYSGPHSIFLPCGDNHIFIDYAWIIRRLYDLFYGVRIDDQNFKGDALEYAIRKVPSVLPTSPCISETGEKRQIDYAYAIGDILIIAECKAVARSIGYDRGKPSAIEYRKTQVIQRVLKEIDEKALWLTKHPTGRNYDITKFKYILPVGISPFIEFIPSLSPYYWVSKNIPRVLTPQEFREIFSNSEINFTNDNLVLI